MTNGDTTLTENTQDYQRERERERERERAHSNHILGRVIQREHSSLRHLVYIHQVRSGILSKPIMASPFLTL
jgi:hypothetical protein